MKTYKGIKKGDLINVKQHVEGYYSGYAGNPIFYLTPDIQATVINPQAISVRFKHYFVFVEFLSPITGKIENAGIDHENIIKVK